MPEWNQSTIFDVSKVFVAVYAALWSSVKPQLLEAAHYLIHHKLGDNVNYVSVHKRNLDGNCNEFLNETLPVWLLQSKGIPISMIDDVWSEGGHPLCEMRLSFVSKLSSMTNRSILIDEKYDNSTLIDSRATTESKSNRSKLLRKVFLAFDGDGNIADYLSYGAVLSSDLSADAINAIGSKSLEFVDMLIAMHGDLFVLNPRSTFSFQIYVIRTILGLDSVPLIDDHDIYCKTYNISDLKSCAFREEYGKTNSFWVSWSSIKEAVKSMVGVRR